MIDAQYLGAAERNASRAAQTAAIRQRIRRELPRQAFEPRAARSLAALALELGVWLSILVIVIPMLVANTVIMSYIVTNHLLRPLVDHDDQFVSSIGVSTHPWLDLIHFNCSHHAEHHLFPAMSSKHYPLVRAKLRRYVGEHLLIPPHWKALLMVFRTPRIHVGKDVLVDPASGRVAAVAHSLRQGGVGVFQLISHSYDGKVTPWISKRVFPGMYLPPLGELLAHSCARYGI